MTIQPLANFFASCLFDLWSLDLVQNSLERMFDTMTTPPPTPWHFQHHSSPTTMATPLPTQPQSLPPPPPPWLPHQYHYHVNSNTITTTKTSSSPPLLITMTTHRSKMYKWELRIKLNKCILPSEQVSEIVQYALHYHYFNLENMIWKERRFRHR